MQPHNSTDFAIDDQSTVFVIDDHGGMPQVAPLSHGIAGLDVEVFECAEDFSAPMSPPAPAA